MLQTGPSQANGVYRDGTGARAMALGGASTASPDRPLEAMSANPAGLSFIGETELQLGVVGGAVQGEFSNSANTNRHTRGSFGALPEVALAYPLKSVPLTLGFAVTPDALASTDWKFVDAPGGLDGNTSYGLTRHHAEIIAIRTAFGASWKFSEKFALGADVGLEYNRNTLIAPYTFQSHPVLTGFKTLLDLQTEGWGVNGSVGLVWKPAEKWSVGLNYRTMTSLETDGDSSGNAGTQLANIGAGSFQPDFHYDTKVSTKLPQTVSAGTAWQATDRLRLITQVDWHNWSESFDRLDITLTHGSNADINGFLGTDQINDSAPLNWRDRFVYRLGAEFALSKEFTTRAGYAYGANPVPTTTLTPMAAAILEHSITCGLEWQRGRWTIAGAYQYDLPAAGNVGASSLASGEFSNSRTEVAASWFGMTATFRF